MNASTPESQGFSAQGIANIDRTLRSYIELKRVAGLTSMVARHGQIVYHSALGILDVEADKPMRQDAIFRIASMTSPISSVAIMMLVEEGHFDLDTPIAAFIPEFKESKVLESGSGDEIVLADLEQDITVRHLFTQTSGLEGYFEDDGTTIEQMYHQKRVELEQNNPPLTLSKMMRAVAKIPLAHQPGSCWAYGLGVYMLAYLVELVTNTPYEKFLQTRIFEPLKMVDTAYYIPPEKAHRLAGVHHYFAEEDQLKRHEFPWMNVPSQPPSYVEGGNLLLSTMDDYARFAQMLLNKGELDGVRLLRPETVELIASNHVSEDALRNGFRDYHDGYGYGLGVRVCMDETQSDAAGSKGEYGWGGLYNTVFWVDPEKSLFGLLMIQQLGFSIAQEFKALVYEAMPM
ncbi:MAG: serine hydrolase domain-containing protein [Chloroflexota bacterium]